MKKILFFICVVMCFLNTQCDDDVYIEEICDKTVVVDEDLFLNITTDNYTIIETEIVDDCLLIDISASGCDGNSWEFNLVDSGAIAESSPEQRYLKFQLINNEACLAQFNRRVSFDLSPLQISGSNEIILHIEGFETSINYTY